MKRRIVALAMLALMLAGACGAEGLMNELRNMRKSAGNRILEMESVPTPTPEATPAPTPDVRYEPLSSGMKGDAVAALQQRLIALGYLGGKADGSYGGKTAAAVKAFQRDAGLEATGEADDATQKALFWSAAPVRKDYQKLDYKQARYQPYAYRGTPVKCAGSVLQVLENDEYADTLGVYTALRVATKGDYDDVVYVAFFRDAAAEPVSEGDKVSIQGTARGLYCYANEAGDVLSLPRIEADSVE